MKKLLLIVAAIAIFPSKAKAQTVVHEVAQSSTTAIQTINICGTPLDVGLNTSSGTLVGRFAIEVYNLAASTNTINCGFDVAISTANNNAFYGREVVAGNGVTWQVDGKRILYCMTQNNLGCTRATITQLK